MNFEKLCAMMKSGEMIQVGSMGGFAGHIQKLNLSLIGVVIGIRPESGTTNINCWLVNIKVWNPGSSEKKRGESIEVFVRCAA